jgi:hypothetical protein
VVPSTTAYRLLSNLSLSWQPSSASSFSFALWRLEGATMTVPGSGAIEFLTAGRRVSG